MNAQRPFRLQIVITFTLLKFSIFLLTIGLLYLTKDMDPNALNAMTGIRDGIIKTFELDINNLDYEFGRLIGKLFFPILFSVLIIYFIVKRKFWPTIVAVILDILTGHTYGVPLLSYVILIVIFTKPAKYYSKNLMVQRYSDLLDHDIK